MSMFRGISKIFNNYRLFNKNTSTNIKVNTLRFNKTFTHSIRVKNSKSKEPGEVIKWVLLVRLFCIFISSLIINNIFNSIYIFIIKSIF